MKAALINLGRKEGGMMHYCSQLANALTKTIAVTVILSDDVNTQLFETKVEIKRIKTPKAYLCKETIASIPKLINTLKDTNPDIIHLTSVHPWLCLVLPLLKKIIKCPIVTTLHDPKPHAGEASIITNLCKGSRCLSEAFFLSFLLFILGVQFLLFAMLFDMQVNERESRSERWD